MFENKFVFFPTHITTQSLEVLKTEKHKMKYVAYLKRREGGIKVQKSVKCKLLLESSRVQKNFAGKYVNTFCVFKKYLQNSNV